MREFKKRVEQSIYKDSINISDDLKSISVTNVNTEDNSSYFFDIIDYLRLYIGTEKIIYVNDDVILGNCEFYKKINLSNCVFLKDAIFFNCKFVEKVDFINSIFHIEANFAESTFQSNTRFHSVIFKKSANFANTKFEKLADFYCAKFEGVQSFCRTDFLDVTIFSHVEFKKQVQFLYNKVSSNSIISFENATFNQALDLSRSNFWCKIQFWSIKVYNIVPLDFWLYENDDLENKTTENKNLALGRVRESYRKIKQEFRQEGNNIEAINFHKYEMLLYKEELNNSNRPIILQEEIILWFNKYSNNFGSSWLRGIGFTISVSILFFAVFLFSLKKYLIFELSCNAVSETLKYFIQFLNITVWEYKPFEIQKTDSKGGMSGIAYTIFFIGRIFIGYGYYQTIQAFRKYGNN